MKNISLIISLLIATTLLAQKKQKVAWYDQDSVIACHPTTKLIEDSIAHFKSISLKNLFRLDSTIAADSTSLAGDTAGYSSIQLALKRRQLQDMRGNRNRYADMAMEDEKMLRENLYAPLLLLIQQSAEKAGKKKGYNVVYASLAEAQANSPKDFDPGRDDITGLVLTECGIAQPRK